MRKQTILTIWRTTKFDTNRHCDMCRNFLVGRMWTSISSAPPWRISMEIQHAQQRCTMEQRESSTMRVISTCTAETGILFIWTIFHLLILIFCIFWCECMWIQGGRVPNNFPCVLECHHTNINSLVFHCLYNVNFMFSLCDPVLWCANIEIKFWASTEPIISDHLFWFSNAPSWPNYSV